LSAAGGLSVAGATGILPYVYAEYDNIADVIPVDYVTNGILVSTALLAGKPALTVIHSSSGHRNPVSWGEYISQGLKYANK
jgi:hypothetical protein